MPRIWIGVHVHAEPPITLLFLGDTGLSPSYGMFRQLCNLLLPQQKSHGSSPHANRRAGAVPPAIKSSGWSRSVAVRTTP
jgi:hypothetical protein